MKAPTEKMTVEKFKSSPITIGVLMMLVGGAVALGSALVVGQSKVEEVAAKVVQMHRDADVDRAHPDMRERYVPRLEHVRDVQEAKEIRQKIQSDVRLIQQSQKRMERDIRKMANGRRRQTWDR